MRRVLILPLLVAACAGEPSVDRPSVGTATWSRLDAPAPRPPGRAWHSLVMDEAGRRLVLFGGQDGGGARRDLWTYDLDGGGWTAVDAEGPSPRWGHGAVVVDGTLWIFGGQGPGGLFADLWSIALDGGAWVRHDVTAAAPAVRYGVGALEHDAARGRLIVTHGFAAGGRHDDTWTWGFAGGAWTNVTPSGERPERRCLHDTAVDAARGVMYLHGGCSSGFGPCPQDDLWAFDLAASRWTRVGASGAPEGRENAALVFDARPGRVLLLHGRGESLTDEVWGYDVAGDRWSRVVSGGPSPRSEADAAIDAAADRVYLFGGRTADGGVSDELWMLQL